MTKSISPLIFRYTIFTNYINTAHIKLNKNFNYLTYFKFFQLILNIIHLYKKKINNFKINKNFLYFKLYYIDFSNICIYLNFFKTLNKKYIIYNYNKLYNLTIYINYFIKYNIYIYYNIFIWLFIIYKKYIYYNKFYIIKTIKQYLLKYNNYYIKIIKFCDKILKTYYKNYKYKLKSLKLIYSGCLTKGGDKKKIFKYINGNVPTSSISSNINYITDSINTYNGTIGIKCWLVF
uniref:Ribosomal protein S3 n=1 Tax=Babesia gibsoni TaxID=33632 RepID=A0A6M8NUR2_BABGI|nr:ribosomal protein S3 [Babesia gibsoni]